MRRSFYERWAKRHKPLRYGPALFWLDDWKTSVVLLSAVASVSVGLLWFFNRTDKSPRRESWPTANARVVDYRIMNDFYRERKGPNVSKYWAEYKVRYKVSDKTYEIWLPTDIESSLRTKADGDAVHDMISGRFAVRYNPKQPWEAELRRESP